MGERSVRNAEVEGSIPFISTRLTQACGYFRKPLLFIDKNNIPPIADSCPDSGIIILDGKPMVRIVCDLEEVLAGITAYSRFTTICR